MTEKPKKKFGVDIIEQTVAEKIQDLRSSMNTVRTLAEDLRDSHDINVRFETDSRLGFYCKISMALLAPENVTEGVPPPPRR